MKKVPVREALYSALMKGDRSAVADILRKHPEFVAKGYGAQTVLHVAATYGHTKLCGDVVKLGCDVNALTTHEKANSTPLMHAVDEGHLDTARWLIEHGARLDNGRYLIGAITNAPNSLEMVKLLVEHGANFNQVFLNELIDEPMTALSTAIDWDRKDVVKYLRSLGAVMPGETPKQPLSSGTAKATQAQPSGSKKSGLLNRMFGGGTSEAAGPASVAEEVVAYFAEHFGPVHNKSLIEILPDDPPITIHVIPAGDDRRHITLFTTGLSAKPMKVPKGSEEYRFAELFIQLPAGWPLTKEKMTDPNYFWPIEWLRKLGKYPHQHQTWLGGPLTVIDNEEPPQRLAPKIPFTCMLLLAEHTFKSRVGNTKGATIQLFRLSPLYTEERNLEHREGAAALMLAFDKHDVPFIVDLKRKNVGL